MNSKDAANLIRTISMSLRDQPEQFQIRIAMTSFSASNTGGVGYVAQNTGGIGFNSNISGPSMDIANNKAHAAIGAEMQQYFTKLDEIEAQLRQLQPNAAKLQSLAAALYADKWVPNVITAVITFALQNFIS